LLFEHGGCLVQDAEPLEVALEMEHQPMSVVDDHAQLMVGHVI
jgi:hypothetical protein